MNSETGDFVAIKRIGLNNISHDQIKSLTVEVDLLKRLNHPNIVKYVDTINTENNLYIIIEYIENGSLSDIIKKFNTLTEVLCVRYIKQVLEGLAYLHNQGVVHRYIYY